MKHFGSSWYNPLAIEPWHCATVMLSIILLSSHTFKTNGKWPFVSMVPCPIVSKMGFRNEDANLNGKKLFRVLYSSFCAFSHNIKINAVVYF